MTGGAFDLGILPEDQRWESDFTYRPAPLPDSVTILTALQGRMLAKRVGRKGIVDYDKAQRFDMARCHLRNLDDLEVQLQWLAGQRRRCIVRGAIAEGQQRAHNVPRLLHGRGDQPATLIETPRRWLAIDIDEPPPGPVETGNLGAATCAAMTMLPREFYEADCIVQATASHGLKPGLRIRLWFWLSRATSTAELKFWFRKAPVDPSVFGAAQITYTASPIFDDETADPVAERLIRMPGRPLVEVPPAADLQPKPKPQRIKPRSPENGVTPFGDDALDQAEKLILGSARGQQERTLFKQSYRIGRVVADGHLPRDFARRVLFNIGSRLSDLDPAWRWTAVVVENKIDRAFNAGVEGKR